MRRRGFSFDEMKIRTCLVDGSFSLPLCAFRLQGFGFLELLLEAVDAAFSIHKFLSTREKRVAIRANFHSDVAFVS